VVRAFVGRAGHHPALDDDDDELVSGAAREIARLVGAASSPIGSAVHRWPAGLPQYEVGHGDRIERIERALRPHPGLFIAGADYRGTGIPDCIRQGREAARTAARAAVESGS
jgi:oxygen-dependent protoporphyrinogen oxidase